MKRCAIVLNIFAVCGLILLTGCEGNETAGPSGPSTTQEWIDQGWSQFISGDYDGCGASFTEAHTLANADYWTAFEDSILAVEQGDSTLLADAIQRLELNRNYLMQVYNGYGWLIIMVNVPEQGTFVFESALSIDSTYADALAGYAILLQTIEEWQQSNGKISTLLEQEPTWEFTYDEDINYLDLKLMRAENYYFLADFEASLQEALEINDIVEYQDGLGAESFNLATVEGRAALIALIDALDDLI